MTTETVPPPPANREEHLDRLPYEMKIAGLHEEYKNLQRAQAVTDHIQGVLAGNREAMILRYSSGTEAADGRMLELELDPEELVKKAGATTPEARTALLQPILDPFLALHSEKYVQALTRLVEYASAALKHWKPGG